MYPVRFGRDKGTPLARVGGVGQQAQRAVAMRQSGRDRQGLAPVQTAAQFDRQDLGRHADSRSPIRSRIAVSTPSALSR